MGEPRKWTSRQLRALVGRLSREIPDQGALLERFIATMLSVRGLRAEHDPIDDPEALALAMADDGLGRLYQALNAPKLEAAYRAAGRQRRKFRDDEIPTVTQLFTPRWVVEFLLQNTLGRLWASMHPDSKLPQQWRWMLPAAGPAPARQIREITVLDPACGTMNFGVVAVEMLDAMYREEIAMAGRRAWPEPSVSHERQIASAIAEHNLFGIDIDPIALKLARTTLNFKVRLPLQSTWQLRCGNALFGTAAGTFDVIVTNPPYLSSRNLVPDVVSRMKRRFPASWRDQYACFIERGIEMLNESGRLGVLVMQSFMFTAGFEKLREQLSDTAAVEGIAHFGPGLFDVGNPGTLQTVAVTMRREPSATRRNDQCVSAIRLIDAADKELALAEALEGDDVHRLRQYELLHSSARTAWSYWLTPRLRQAFVTFPKLKALAPPRQGLATTDNARFVRYWWELTPTSSDAPCRATPNTWFPYVKSGRFRRWYESPRHRVNWRDDGREIKAAIVDRYPYLDGQWQWVAKNARHYFQPGLTYSYLTSGRFSARLMEAGAIFDVAGSALFPQEDALPLLGLLNSSVARQLLEAINPTVNFQVSDVGELPVPKGIGKMSSLREDVARAVELMRVADTWEPTSPTFVAPLPWRDAEERMAVLHRELCEVEQRIEMQIAAAFKIEPERSQPQPPSPRLIDQISRGSGWAMPCVMSWRGTASRFASIRSIGLRWAPCASDWRMSRRSKRRSATSANSSRVSSWVGTTNCTAAVRSSGRSARRAARGWFTTTSQRTMWLSRSSAELVVCSRGGGAGKWTMGSWPAWRHWLLTWWIRCCARRWLLRRCNRDGRRRAVVFRLSGLGRIRSKHRRELRADRVQVAHLLGPHHAVQQ
jgi:hypothetical protein